MQADSSAAGFWRRKEVLLLVALAVTAPLAYALYTGHIWEDYFITFRFSQNLIDGKGLVFNTGQRVHGFTSPLGVLLPAFCYLLTGKSGYLPALWLFRVLCIAAYVGGGLLLLHKVMQMSASRWTRYAFVLLYCLEAKMLAFTVDGMETALMLLFIGWVVFLWDRTTPRTWLWRGLAWAGLMWTRPDGCVYVAMLGLTEFAWGTSNRKELFFSWLRSAGVTTVVYLPWLVFTCVYYGSPIPQTILAKTPVGISELGVGGILGRIYFLLPHRAAYALAPIYFPIFWQDGPDWVFYFSYATAIFALVYWLLPLNDRLGRMASFCFTLLSVYLAYLALPFPWYVPPVAVFAMICLCSGIVTLAGAIARNGAANRLWTSARSPRVATGLTCCGFALLGGGVAGVLELTVRQIYVHEHEIEMGNRMQIGLWLRDHVRPEETVFLEPIGYIGYFSQAHIVDWPGLVSPRVVELRRQGVTLEKMPNELRPTWMLFRPHEIKKMVEDNPGVLNEYTPIKVFDVKNNLRRYEPIPGKEYVALDSTFLLFKRKEAAGDTAVAPQYEEGARDCDRYLSALLAAPPNLQPGGS